MPFLHSLQQGAENTVTGMLNVSDVRRKYRRYGV